MLFGSIFQWTFIGASLILCTVFLQEYEVNRGVGRLVLGGSLLTSLGIAASLTVIARRFAVPKILASMAAGPYSGSKLAEIFWSMSRKMGITGVELREARVGNAFSASLKSCRIVAVSPSLGQSLSEEEFEAVLAHELSHFKNHDGLAKGLARLARFAFPFDPSIRLVEAAIHRERELLADRASVGFTGKPLALASALIKVHSAPALLAPGVVAGLFVGSTGKRWFDLYPNLERRVEILLAIADRQKSLQKAHTVLAEA